MADQINGILQGQITPQARPVDAFIRPGDTNIAQPNQMPRLGQPSQINTIATAGTPNVAGENQFARLAQDLAEFNPQLTKALQSMGVMYADEQMKAGERYAKEQALKALANNDNQMERAELDRAAQNRRLGAKDPNAGSIMASLNPYFGMGVERGNAKLAADKAEIGLPAYIARNQGRIDYNAPDQGFGALAQMQAEYTQQLTQEWGLSAGSPGFQKYTLPSIEKARDRVSQQHIQDRKNYFDTVGVQQTTAQIRQMYLTTQASGVIEMGGRTYSRAESPERFREMQQYKAQQILDNLLLRQSLPGEASKRSEDVYSQLSKIADYGLDDDFNKFVNSIPSQQMLKDENGKAVVNPATNQPFRLSWGEVYQSTSIDSEMKYEQAGLERRKRKLLESVGGYEEGLLNAISGIAPGPEQEAAASAYTRRWYEENGRAAGISLYELQKRRADVVKLDDNIYSEGQDPNLVSNFYTDLNQSYGTDFNATRWRQRMNEVAAGIRDPKERTAFLKGASSDIAGREKEMSTFSGYSSTRDKTLNEAIASNTASYYNVSQAGDNPRLKANVEESKARQRTVFTQRANDLIAKEEARLKRRLTDSEVRALSRAAVFGDKSLGIPAYGEGDGKSGKSGLNQKDYLFPGSKRSEAPDAPDPSGRTRPGRMYELEQLNNIQSTSVLSRYRDAAILTPDATLKAWAFVQSGRALPPQLDRVWRKAGARSAADFVLGQMDYHRRALSSRGATGDDLEKFNPSPSDRTKVLQQSTRAAAGGNTTQSIASNVGRTPLLAQLGGAALNALTGAAPASAATFNPEQAAPARLSAGGGRIQGGGDGGRAAAAAAPAPAAAAPFRAQAPARRQEVAMASPAPRVMGDAGGDFTPVGIVRPAPLPGWGIDEAGNLISPTRGRPTVEDPVMLSPRLRAVRSDYGVGGGSFEKPVSVVYERQGGQPGVDLYFPSKRFPAVLGGVVKDVSRQGGAGSGYGNYVVVESVDPLTGKRVDVLYGHLADGVKVRPGQRIEAGQIIGQQGGTGRVVSQDGTIASIDFFSPRPAGSKDMTPYSGFDALRRHVVSTLQQGGGGKPVGGQGVDGYLKRLAYLETRIRNIPNSEGSGAMGFFQSMGPFHQEATAASGGLNSRSANYNESAKAVWAWIQRHKPDAAAAIKRGRYEEADRLLRGVWPSLPGGSQAQPDYVQRDARRYLS